MALRLSSLAQEVHERFVKTNIVPSSYVVPIKVNKWCPLAINSHTPVYLTPISPVPFVANSCVIPTQLCPYTGAIITDPYHQRSTPVPQAVVPELVSGLSENFYKPIEPYVEPQQPVFSPLSIVNNQIYYKTLEDILTQDSHTIRYERINTAEHPLQMYLNLPRKLFPRARRLALDPNPLIEEFCKQLNIEDHTDWILDLEFGMPREAITRVIPIYSVKFNSIHCKNTPNTVHPGFESCGENFKRTLLFYYDYIISAWYRGYVMVNNDRSVENFQAWLLIAMQVFGMCWP